MKNIVEFIVKQLVDDKDAVVVTETQDGALNILNVKVNEGELGKVIGKGGKIATSIRTIVKSLSIKEKKRYIVKIGDK